MESKLKRKTKKKCQKTKAENDIAQTQQDLTITGIEQNSVEQEYTEKIAKAQGEQYQSMSQIASSQGDVAKLKNQVTNYTIRNGMYYILAPQGGQIIQAKKIMIKTGFLFGLCGESFFESGRGIKCHTLAPTEIPRTMIWHMEQPFI